MMMKINRFVNCGNSNEQQQQQQTANGDSFELSE